MSRFFLTLLVIVFPSIALPAGEFQFKDGDRVALVGSTLIEREQKYGYWELALTTRHPDKNITFRNLGWSGDSVWGESRVGFDLDNPQKGFERLRDAVLAVKPTIIIVGYGTNESFAAEAGLPRFKEGLNKLLDAFAPTKARIVLLSPLYLRDRSLPQPHREQQKLRFSLYSDAIREIAKRRGHHFIDFQRFQILSSTTWKSPELTDYVMHLTEYGYWRYAAVIELGLGYERRYWQILLDLRSGTFEQTGFSIEKLDSAAMKCLATDTMLPVPWPHLRPALPKGMFGYGWNDLEWVDEPESEVQVKGLAPGKYELKIDGNRVADGSAMDWGFVRTFERRPEFDQAEKLRQAIIEKNQLFFHRYRPQNETYLFGFRKHEQGNNAVEVPRFDALIEAKEKEIAKLRVPVKHTYELVPSK